MDSDRELLGLAAKAAGLEVASIADDGQALMLYGVQEPWNPRYDNGQAFELAIRAGVSVRRIDQYVYAIGRKQFQARIGSGDMMAAARDAVVLAAAEIGKAMHEPKPD